MISSNITGAVIGLPGAVIGAASGLGIAFINRYFDDRAQIRKIAIDMAFQQWKAHLDFSQAVGMATGRLPSVQSLDSYVIHMVKLSEMICAKSITAENVEEELRKIRMISDEACRAAVDKEEEF